MPLCALLTGWCGECCLHPGASQLRRRRRGENIRDNATRALDKSTGGHKRGVASPGSLATGIILQNMNILERAFPLVWQHN